MSSTLITLNATGTPGLPALGRTLTAFKEKVVGPESTDPKYLDSFAEQLSDLDVRSPNDRCRWALAGNALKTWEGEDPKDGFRRRIDELIDEHEGEIYKGWSVRCDATTRHRWMLGSDQAYARPTVVISHLHEMILKRTMRVILRSEILKSKGFELRRCANCDLEPLTVDTDATLHYLPSRFSLDEEPRQGLPISLCGAEIEVKNSTRSATLGGVLIFDGTYYGVTVAHAFTENGQSSKEGLSGPTNVTLYDSDWAESSSEDESIDLGSAKKRDTESPTPTMSTTYSKSSHGPLACAIRSDRLLVPDDMGYCLVAEISSQNPLRHTDDSTFDDVDWALIKISNPIYHGINGVVSDDGERGWLASTSFRNYPPRGSILTATRRGTMRGLGTGSTSSIKLLGSSRSRGVWSIQTERALGTYSATNLLVDMHLQPRAP